MSLLDTASLLLTPNAYKEGKLYSVIPSDGSGDFTFTRATTATRVNSDGLVELVPYNLVERSEEFNNAYWVKASSSVTANTATAPNGTMTADTVTLSSTTGRIEKVVSLTSNINYTLSVYAKNIDASNSRIGMLCINNANTICGVFFDIVGSGAINAASNATGVIESVGNGWYRCSMTFNSQSGATSPTIRIVNNAASGTGWTNGQSIYIWGAQLVEGTNALPYQKTETRLNIPRLDYSLGGCPNILLEPQRTNLALQSSSFDSATWTKSNTTIVANNAISPSGVQDADLIYPTTTGSTRFAFQSASGASATYTLSVYAKAQNKSVVWLYVNSSGSFGSVFFDLANGTLQVLAGSVSTPIGKIEYLDNGWYKCSITPSSTFSLSNAGIGVADALGNFTVSNNGTDGIFIWGAQLEAGAYATSYIPTTTASVTRNADVCSKTGISSLIGQTEGTLFVEMKALVNGGVVRVISLSDGTTQNRITIEDYSSADFIVSRVTSANVQEAFMVASPFTQNIYRKIAVKYKLNDCAIFINGVKVAFDTSVNMPISLSDLGFDSGAGAEVYDGNVKTLAIYKTALTDDECIQLTTI